MRRIFAGLLAVCIAGPLAAQQSGVTSRVQNSLDSKYIPPDCGIKANDFRVSSGATYLKTGIETSVPENRARALNDGERVISDAIKNAGQDKNPAAWYFLGRIYLQQGDLAGADSAFTRAETMAPKCKEEIGKFRYRVWAGLVNGGIDLRSKQQDDSAMALFSAASSIYRGAPLADINVAEIYTARNQPDSAVVYFGKAAATEPTDTAQVKLRNQAAFNYGALLLNSKRYQEAVTAFHRYLGFVPDDQSALKGLASAFRGAGMTDSAQVIENRLASTATTTSAGGGGDASGLSVQDLYDLAARQYQDKNYAAAAETFGKVLEQRPYMRDAVFGQVNAYIGAKDGAKLAEAAKHLTEFEPLSEFAWSALAQGYRDSKNQAGLVDAITTREALPVDIQNVTMKATADGGTFSAKAIGREARDVNNKVIPPAPTTIVVEFLSDKGQVVGTSEVTIPALPKGQQQDISAQGTGAGIRDWRYKKK